MCHIVRRAAATTATTTATTATTLGSWTRLRRKREMDLETRGELKKQGLRLKKGFRSY